MHMPRIFTTPVMSGYAYSGFSSKEYKDSICYAITSGAMSYAECMEVVRGCVSELFSVFTEIREFCRVSEEHVRRIERLRNYVNAESTLSAEPAVQGRVLYGMITRLYGVLYDCTVAECNKEVAWFMDSGFTGRGVHLQIAQACGILVNSIAIASCFAKTVAAPSLGAVNESDADEHSAFHANMALSAYVNAKFSALSRCLNSSPGAEETKRRKAILRVVRHNIELCNKVAELLDPEMPSCFRDRTGDCLDSLLAAVRSSSAECKEMVCNNESVQRRLAIARKALLGVQCHFKVYRKLAASHDFRRFKKGEYAVALVHMMGSLFSMYRGYATAGNAEHIVASKIERCIKILFTLYRYNARRSGDLQCKAREVYADILCVYAEINEHIRPDLLLNPQAEIRWRDAALQYCTELMDIWKALHGRHLDVFEQPEGSPSQPSTSGLGGTGSRVRGPQASSVPLRVLERIPIPYGAPWDQPSTSGMGGTAGTGSQQASYIPPQDPGHMPDLDVQPSTSYAQPSTSGLGGNPAGQGALQAQAPCGPLQDHSYAQPSTSGLGGNPAGQGALQAQAPCGPLQDHSYAQPSTSGLGGNPAGQGALQAQAPCGPLQDHSYAQPSTSGLGGASSTLEGAQVVSPRSQTPSNDDLEPSSKRSRSA
ncbi:hypothetical protein O997_01890 [Anaplasma phagocytophilum str. MRK]|uniref:HGE-14 family type IV secretion system effector n=1 Tax=Anaplasma phagocytophilum TaxID=948 RepID=UPI000533BC0A|nr:hypothetical protein [Anaplasma phagocytophilum]KDB56179.1 hypothetical protein O997_01890 [Anaplasma phagocytophilum str. MRK]